MFSKCSVYDDAKIHVDTAKIRSYDAKSVKPATQKGTP